MKKNKPKSYYWNAKGLNDTNLASNAYFFSQDMGQDANFYHNRDASIKFTIEPSNDELVAKIPSIMSVDRYSSRYGHHDLTESLKSLIESIINNIYFFGSVHYEIYESDQGFRLLNIMNHTIRELIGYYFQILPKEIVLDRDNKSIMNILDRSSIAKFSFPKRLGGNRRLKRIKSELNKTNFDIYLKEMTLRMDGKGNKYFDQEYFQYLSKVIIAKNCYNLGWYKRNMEIGGFTEYSQIKLILNQRKSTAIMRHDVLDQINTKLLPKILNRLEIENAGNYIIKAKKMDKPSYYEGLLNDLKNRKKSIKELREILFGSL